MIPYVICTILSCFFIHMGTHDRMKSKKINIWVILAILIPSILAGARDISVGTDTSTYGVPFFTYALQRSFESYMTTAGGDPLWLILVYGLSRLTSNVFWELFLIELVIMIFTYKALKQYDLGKYTWIGFLVYHMMFYSFTLNLMRQFVSLSVLLYSFKYIREHKWKRYFLICFILLFIQKTSIIALLLYPIYHLTTENYAEKFMSRFKFSYSRLFLKFIFVAGVCLVVLFAGELIVYVSNLFGMFTSQVQYMTESQTIVWRNLVYMLPLLAFMFIFGNELVKRNPVFNFFTLLLIVYIILWQLQGISRESYRIGFYFGYYIILSIPMIIKGIKKRDNRVALFWLIFILMAAFYVDYFVVHLYNETYPYTSTLLGIG